MFTSRPFFLICDCKRSLSSGKKMLTRTAPSAQFAQMAFERKVASLPRSSLPADDGRDLANKPKRMANIGNTCYADALLQCCKHMLARISLDRLPKSDEEAWSLWDMI